MVAVYRLINKWDNKVVQYRNPQELGYDIHGKVFYDFIVIKTNSDNIDILINLVNAPSHITKLINYLKDA